MILLNSTLLILLYSPPSYKYTPIYYTSSSIIIHSSGKTVPSGKRPKINLLLSQSNLVHSKEREISSRPVSLSLIPFKLVYNKSKDQSCCFTSIFLHKIVHDVIKSSWKTFPRGKRPKILQNPSKFKLVHLKELEIRNRLVYLISYLVEIVYNMLDVQSRRFY